MVFESPLLANGEFSHHLLGRSAHECTPSVRVTADTKGPRLGAAFELQAMIAQLVLAAASRSAKELTLRYAFCERVGVPPKAHINALRLSRVRSALHSASCGRLTVQDTAARWGFWHLSQFSHDYRELFGELPSQTLRRTD